MHPVFISSIVLACHLIPIAWIDFQRFVIPNALNLSLAICGMTVSVFVLGRAPVNVLFASGLTVAIFLGVGRIYVAVRNRSGVGAGDVKFLGAAAAWTGLLGIPWVILIASISGLALVLVASMRGQAFSMNSRMPFGPHLSLGLMLTWLLGDAMVADAWRMNS